MNSVKQLGLYFTKLKNMIKKESLMPSYALKAFVAMLIIWGPQLSLAQITIEHSDYAKIANEYTLAVSLPEEASGPGSAGGNKHWDFSTLTASQNTINSSIIAPSEAPYSSQFPDADMVISNLFNAAYAYVKTSAGQAEIIGIASDFLSVGKKFVFPLEPPFIQMKFPLSYQDSWNTNYQLELEIDASLLGIPGVKKVKIVRSTNANIEVDSWGLLELPNRTYDCLRMKSANINSDEVYFKYPFIGYQLVETSSSFDTSYSWYAKYVGFPVLSIGLDPMSAASEKTITWLLGSNVSVVERPEVHTGIYPNPASDELYIDSKESLEIDIFDLNAKLQLHAKTQDQGRKPIDISTLEKGIYILRMIDEAGQNQIHKKLIIDR
jgi:hypothetical protein